MNLAKKISINIRLFIRKFFIWRKNQISDKNFLIIASIIVGIFAGLSAIILKSFVHFFQESLTSLSTFGNYYFLYLVYPAIGIFLTLLYLHIFHRGKISKGISNIIYAVSRNSAEVPRSNTYSHIITSALTVGFGGSAGLEAPIVITGAALGSNIAKDLRLSYRGRTLLLACGSAAGISAIFNSPIAGVIFAFEVLITEFSIPTIIPLLIASATSAVISKLLYSGQLFFLITEGWKLEAIPYYIILGIVCGLTSAYMIRTTLKVEEVFGRIKSVYRKALLGSAILGIMIFIFPPLYGEGYETIKLLLSGNYNEVLKSSLFAPYSDNLLILLIFILAIILVKVFATSITIGSGGNGGIFAPSLFTGALVGMFVAGLINFSGIVKVDYPNFIAVGMAGILSGVIHAPLTGIFLIAEITGGYALFVPLMIVSAISFFTSRYLEKYSVYTKILAERGNWSPSDKDKNVLSQISISELIETNFAVLTPTNTLKEILDILSHSRRNIFPVVNKEGELLGLIHLDDVREVILDIQIYDIVLAYEMMTKPVVTVEENASMNEVMKKFDYYKVWNIPVVNKNKYVGFVSKSTIFNKYRDLLIKQSSEIL